MDSSPNSFAKYFPAYLTDHQKNSLNSELKKFQECLQPEYLQIGFEEEMLQGDGWRGLEIYSLDEGKGKKITGIIVSNSCDITTENDRKMPVKISFVPLIKLSSYRGIMVKNGISPAAVEGKIKSILNQDVSNIFYLPSGIHLEHEHIAILDDVHSISRSRYLQNTERSKFFTLSMFGFYMFVFKLSIHFCRIHENINRSST